MAASSTRKVSGLPDDEQLPTHAVRLVKSGDRVRARRIEVPLVGVTTPQPDDGFRLHRIEDPLGQTKRVAPVTRRPRARGAGRPRARRTSSSSTTSGTDPGGGDDPPGEPEPDHQLGLDLDERPRRRPLEPRYAERVWLAERLAALDGLGGSR